MNLASVLIIKALVDMQWKMQLSYYLIEIQISFLKMQKNIYARNETNFQNWRTRTIFQDRGKYMQLHLLRLEGFWRGDSDIAFPFFSQRESLPRRFNIVSRIGIIHWRPSPFLNDFLPYSQISVNVVQGMFSFKKKLICLFVVCKRGMEEHWENHFCHH